MSGNKGNRKEEVIYARFVRRVSLPAIHRFPNEQDITLGIYRVVLKLRVIVRDGREIAIL
jgi:hypothetical protein